jgi:hypothetical protein
VAKRVPSQVYATLIEAGFSPDQAVIMTAIAGAESSYNPAALGDVRLQTATWGPSYGLFQIRTLKADTGRGTNRDISRLGRSDLEQARAAYAISHQGRDFTPWTVYRTGAYQSYLPGARAAATDVGVVVPARAEGDGPFPTWGPKWLPWNWPSAAGNAAAEQALGGARHIAVEAAFVGLGLVLVAAGAYVATRPADNRLRRRVLGVVGLS